MRMKTLSFHHSCAGQSKAALAAVFGCVPLCAEFCALRLWEKEEFSVSEDAIYVKQKQLDFAGTRAGVRHWGIVAKDSRSTVSRRAAGEPALVEGLTEYSRLA